MEDKKTILLSEEASKEQVALDEEKIINRNPIWKSPKFITASALCLITVIVTITIVILSASGDEDDIAHKLETARKYLTEMKYEEAKAIYEEIIKTDPKCEEAYIGLADVYIGLGDENKAIEVLEKGIDKVRVNSDLKKKLNELEEKLKDKDDNKETDIETDITENIVTDAVTEPEGEAAVNNESTEVQYTTVGEDTGTDVTSATEGHATTIIQQTTTYQQQTTIQQQTTVTANENTTLQTADIEKTTSIEEATETPTSSTELIIFSEIKCDGWFSNFSQAYEITEEGLELVFKSKTDDYIDAEEGAYWDTPLYIIHYEENDFVMHYWEGDFCFINRSDVFGWIPYFDGKEESDGFEWINTQDGTMFTDMGYTYKTEGVPESREEWVKWLEANKNGVDCTFRAVRDGDKVVIEFTNNGVTSMATVPIDENKTLYVTLTGEYCTLLNIQKKIG